MNQWTIITIIASLLILGFFVTSGQTVVPVSDLGTSGITYHVPLDGSYTDVVGSSTHTPTGSGLSFQSGKVGTALNFSNGAYISSNILYTFGDSYSVCMWHNRGCIKAAHFRSTLMCHGNYQNSKINGYLYRYGPDNYLNVNSHHGTIGMDVNSLNTWFHSCLIVNGSNIKGYLNGNLKGSIQFSDPNLTNGYQIGRCTVNSGESYLCGKIDDIQHYDRILSSDEISFLYNNPGSFASHCFDGLKNGDEAAIDCGGHCSACSASGSSGTNPDMETQIPDAGEFPAYNARGEREGSWWSRFVEWVKHVQIVI